MNTVQPQRTAPKRVLDLIERIAKSNDGPVRATSHFRDTVKQKQEWVVTFTGPAVNLSSVVNEADMVLGLDVKRSGANVVTTVIVLVKP